MGVRGGVDVTSGGGSMRAYNSPSALRKAAVRTAAEKGPRNIHPPGPTPRPPRPKAPKVVGRPEGSGRAGMEGGGRGGGEGGCRSPGRWAGGKPVTGQEGPKGKWKYWKGEQHPSQEDRGAV